MVLRIKGSATHLLDCRKIDGKQMRHAENNILNRALQSAGLPSHVEPAGLSAKMESGRRSNYFGFGKRQSLVWDFTCVKTACLFQVCRPQSWSSNAKRWQIKRKIDILPFLGAYIFTRMAVETPGTWTQDPWFLKQTSVEV